MIQGFSSPSTAAPHFRALGVPVRVELSFLIVTAILAMSRDPIGIVQWIAVSFVCILIHELGHALIARRFGHGVQITLHGMGGSAWHAGPSLSTSRKVAISLAGPFAGFGLGAIAFVLLALLPEQPAVDSVLSDVLWITWFYGFLNLLPIIPLDGGHALQAVLQKKLGGERGADVVAVVSLVFCAALFAAALFFRVYGAGFLVVWLGIANWPRIGAWLARRKQAHDVAGHAIRDAQRDVKRDASRHDVQ